MPSVTLCRPFSLRLISSQFATTCFRPGGFDVAEDMGMAVHQLVVDAPGHSGQVEAVLLGGQPGVEDDLEEQVAQLLFEVGGAAPACGPAVIEARPGRRGPRRTPRPGGA